eukprot:Protomagalhaensia_sp_Gyna_25__3867@NODE_3474_length_565_cov_2648_365019_g2926_i0_p1_GENE_NODE_3474_length_565_cov_2648_365019_g2926_i0NODE_3474_length_565_cov_2648_365019_g2926_i0_p1_ORF_typecomplete_len116_score23_60Thioredoxin/PF00085_20/3_5e24Thioredoxin_7/PF13899_6/1_4e06Phosducin/PF02114_16/1_6e06AhpCTSA/PF00578_21/2_4e05Thioredoxin_9/PF14595_6/2_8e05Thioredox_DsbH/PF03190_15/0_0002Redoxin/PF08534_10/0_00027Thioredoxin_8/PF13905_6/0_00042Thioredoxin_2/PF13098_6/0_0051OST3_OST6/PF04756_13/0_
MPVTDFDSADAFNTAKSGEVPLVVDFYAEWCGPCKAISPLFHKWADSGEYSAVKFGSINVDDYGEIAESESIEGMPTFKFYHKGEEIASVVGADSEEIQKQIKNLVARAPASKKD